IAGGLCLPLGNLKAALNTGDEITGLINVRLKSVLFLELNASYIYFNSKYYDGLRLDLIPLIAYLGANFKTQYISFSPKIGTGLLWEIATMGAGKETNYNLPLCAGLDINIFLLKSFSLLLGGEYMYYSETIKVSFSSL